ncbi:homoserine dehydrogenase [Carboxydocella sporoproducens DSM 16521]|uniref:Homoserine dehydrogenase n=2 Tax=Carboxydocella TaxID=178898 RepID=A0A1T4RNX4_9FIRM|nr:MULTISPECIES: homoserine dehydrogenase [Carboxydocella]AVX20428.1 homoserine dehydrogenase [Carboxydocella thermautotrophica]AVX30850.1 homoserine dehydrogenase [Carboxydocella thermautotrophica]SKA17577.1 homoserine dehydrogenase [Carboxydocella sporoproducens DSM 16521]
MQKRAVKIGIIGFGTVGRGVYRILTTNQEKLIQRVGIGLEIAGIAVRDLKKPRQISAPQDLFTADPWQLVNDPGIDIIVEVMGGTELARELVLQALRNGKSVITANKDLIAQHGQELFAEADAARVDLLFEASVGGGIPIIRPLKQCLAANNISQVMGIINGTTNYMLTKMTQEGSDYEEVLREAQAMGYAEADPTADVGGFDAARKLAILASIAFHTRITFDQVYVEGITRISAKDITYAREMGYVIKLLGVAKEHEGRVEVRVHPALVPQYHPLAAVNDAFNAIFVRGDAVGDTMFYGRGAGELPTASAVVADIMDAARNINLGNRGRISCTCYEQKEIIPIQEMEGKYYIRLRVLDKPGVLAAIASVFGQEEVSLRTVIQKETIGDKAELVLVTHYTKEGNVRQALRTIGAMTTVEEIANVIRVEGEEV